MREWLEGLHWTAATGFMWSVGIVRTSLIYWLGRLAATGGERFAKIRLLMNHPLYRRAQLFVNRWGVLAVPACFLTVGFQTAVILTTGVTRMPLRRWVPAMLVGTLIWGAIYATVGLSVLWLWLENPIVAALVLVALVTVIVIVKRVERRRSMPNLPAAVSSPSDRK
ncbi:DedA family protein [Rothia nasisuis]|uniref:DedA family protein n=1 Tax=Rothia nasisuis TaxID=2109647 RepID=UPI001F1D6F97|nr:hypothetical protein [Rothia nasisuis]